MPKYVKILISSINLPVFQKKRGEFKEHSPKLMFQVKSFKWLYPLKPKT